MWKRILKIASIVLFLMVVAALVVFLSMDFRWSDARFLKETKKSGCAGFAFQTTTSSNNVRYLQSGELNAPTVVFIHGAPGSSRDYREYLLDEELCSQFNMMAADRPGYGFSEYGLVVTSIQEQARRVAAGIPDNSIIVGHSYGGPVAAAIAMYHPEKVRELLLLAPAVDPDNEKQFFVNGFMRFRLLRRFMSPALEVALDEKLSHENALEQLVGDWELITAPVTLVHGEKDRIVPFENVSFLERVLVNAPLDVQAQADMNHILIWTDFEWVKELLLSFADHPRGGM
ncbi:MAG: alpha/beta hydrolase [Bacteroidetes bacterium]|nr:alpha/beta hydrolase [Bacteroidota bacterium]